jgi:hypothetical protein
MFLNTNDGDIDKSTRMLQRHYEVRKKAPQIFTRRDASRPELKKTMAHEFFVNLPTTPDRYLVVYDKLAEKSAKHTVYDNTTTVFNMMIRN